MITHEWVLDNFEYRDDGLYWIKAGGPNRKLFQKAGYNFKNAYRRIGITIDGVRQQILEHRLCWFYMTGKWPTEYIDHIDRNGMNNARWNLREATHGQNEHNSKSLGVSYYKDRNKWLAYVNVNKRRIHLKFWDTYEQAITARRAGELKYFGQFAPIK